MKTALLVIDIQQFYFPGGANPLANPEKASARAAKLLEHFRKTKLLVVHIRHQADEGFEIHPNVKPLDTEKVITKNNINCYLDTELLDYLNSNNIERVVIAGMMTHVCVEAAARASADLGFRVIVAEDACTTRDVEFKGSKVSARQVHLTALATIGSYYGKVMTTEDIITGF